MKRFLIPVKIAPSFWLVSFLVGWLASSELLGGVLWIVVVLISVYIHEMGHAVIATVCGQRAHILLNFFGGVTYRHGPKVSKVQDFFIVLAGPLCSLLLAVCSLYVMQNFHVPALVHALLQISFLANMFWAILNMMPVLPLDGGRIMQILLQSIFGEKGERLSYGVSALFSLILMIVFLYINQVIIGSLFFLFGYDAYRTWKNIRYAPSKDISEEIDRSLITAAKDWKEQHPQQAIERLEMLAKKTVSSEVVIRLAHYLITTEQPKKALFYLEQIEKRLSIDGLKLLQLAAYETMDWQKTAKVGEKIFLEEGGDVSVALLNAFASARMALPETSVHWLVTALEKGSVDIKKVLATEDFDLIRQTDVFLRFVTHLTA